MTSPVLLIIFNRAGHTQRLIAALRKVQPRRIYVAADGPRTSHKEDETNCQITRETIESIDWPCSIETLYQEKNLGCRFGPETAINWFFQHENAGIILEDDCIPHPDFFVYCDFALEAYRENQDVWHVNGSNFNAPRSLFEGKAVAFSALAQVWGWATWKNRWAKREGNPYYLNKYATKARTNWQISHVAALNQFKRLTTLKNGFNTWDYQWQITILNNKGLCLSCVSNLIANIGDGDDATHTKSDARTNLPTQALPNNFEYTSPALSLPLTNWYEKKMGLDTLKGALAHFARTSLESLKSFAEKSLSIVLYGRVPPIVIASTGRAGSTVLFDALAEGYIRKRFGIKPSAKIPRLLRKTAQVFTPRLRNLSENPQPVHKTHDLPPQRFPNGAKFIFIYGSPLESALSAHQMTIRFGTSWLDEHIYNLAGSHSGTKVLEQDVLNFERQLDSWTQRNDPNILTIHFDQIWERIDEISAFLGFEIQLAPKRQRTPKDYSLPYDKTLFEGLEKKASEAMKSQPLNSK